MKGAAKRAVISSGLEVSSLLASLGLLKHARGQGAIFTLHHVRPKPSAAFRPNDLLEITPEFLDSALETLESAGYEFIPLYELPNRIERPSSRPFACLTLDDGYRDNAAFAADVFNRHSAPFTIFINSGFVERTHTMWWETLEVLLQRADAIEFDFGKGPEKLAAGTPSQKRAAFERVAAFVNGSDEKQAVAQLDAVARAHGVDPSALVSDLTMDSHDLLALAAKSQVSYGAHTVSHRGIARLPNDEAEAEIAASIAFLGNLTGKPVTTFAYPYGDSRSFAPREQATLKRLGIEVAVTTRPGTITAAHAGEMTALPRISLNGLYQKARYVRALASGIPFKMMS